LVSTFLVACGGSQPEAEAPASESPPEAEPSTPAPSTEEPKAEDEPKEPEKKAEPAAEPVFTDNMSVADAM
jgi:hypothetical protein